MNIKLVITKIIFKIFGLLKIKSNKLVISSFYGNIVGDSPMYLAEELLRDNDNWEIIWLTRNPQNIQFDKKVKIIKYQSIASIYHLSTAKFWIDNVRKSRYIHKRKEQIYIQTWHGAPALKKIEKDVESILQNDYIENAKADSQKIDYLLSNSHKTTNIFRNSFWYDGIILEYGTPRNDILFKGHLREKIKQELNLNEEKIVVLYAPTFREDNKFLFYIDYEKIKEKISIKYKKDVILIRKLHSNLYEKENIFFNKKNILDIDFEYDIQKLLLITDILISDYSSLIFDFMITNKPCFLYMVDYKEYTRERDFYFELSELPFEIAFSFDELEKKIDRFELERYKQKIEIFKSQIGYTEKGNSSIKIINLLKQIKNKESLCVE